jgi:hypothetical protein
VQEADALSNSRIIVFAFQGLVSLSLSLPRVETALCVHSLSTLRGLTRLEISLLKTLALRAEWDAFNNGDAAWLEAQAVPRGHGNLLGLTKLVSLKRLQVEVAHIVPLLLQLPALNALEHLVIKHDSYRLIKLHNAAACEEQSLQPLQSLSHLSHFVVGPISQEPFFHRLAGTVAAFTRLETLELEKMMTTQTSELQLVLSLPRLSRLRLGDIEMEDEALVVMARPCSLKHLTTKILSGSLAALLSLPFHALESFHVADLCLTVAPDPAEAEAEADLMTQLCLHLQKVLPAHKSKLLLGICPTGHQLSQLSALLLEPLGLIAPCVAALSLNW